MMSETDRQRESWSDRLKRAIKPQWMIEREKKHPPGKDNWRLGHLLWLATLGSPAETDEFSRQVERTVAGKGHAPETNWQEREKQQRANQSLDAPSSPTR
jgi:hypothetical protein